MGLGGNEQRRQTRAKRRDTLTRAPSVTHFVQVPSKKLGTLNEGIAAWLPLLRLYGNFTIRYHVT